MSKLADLSGDAIRNMEAIIRTPSEITKILESAFAPLRCVAESFDYEQGLKIRIFNKNDGAILSFPNQRMAEFKDGERIYSFIAEVRARLEKRGFQ